MEGDGSDTMRSVCRDDSPHRFMLYWIRWALVPLVTTQDPRTINNRLSYVPSSVEFHREQ